MARTNVVNSATSQFFINTADNVFLNHGGRDFGYAVFGKVTSGFDVVDKISKVKTTSIGPYDDVPVTPVVMKKVYVKV
jgi:peptidyl-prolyl cis-trans isomerase A (cyclophilin A)